MHIQCADDLFANTYELWSEPAAPRANAETKLHLLVRRQGGKQPLSNVLVRFYLGDPKSGGAALGDGSIALLSPRSKDNTTGVAWTPPSAGAYEIYAVIDPENAVAETYE
ncbi:MAG TPA: CARDB domain-containing protein, partial [Caldilineaceae bacterium]|nr:CARDB domain-containing protein [Caldilineaceae bacterium]